MSTESRRLTSVFARQTDNSLW